MTNSLKLFNNLFIYVFIPFPLFICRRCLHSFFDSPQFYFYNVTSLFNALIILVFIIYETLLTFAIIKVVASAVFSVDAMPITSCFYNII